MEINTLWTLTKGPNPIKPTDVALKMFPSGLNMYSWDYTSDESWAAKRRDEYKTRMTTYIKNLGVVTNETAIRIDVEDVLKFEVELAKITPDWRNDIYEPKLLKLKKLYRDYLPVTKVNWKDYITAMYPEKLAPAEYEPIFIEEASYFQNLSKLISHSQDRTLANYMAMSLLYNLADHLPEHISGQISAHKRWDYDSSPLYYQCATVTEKLMPWATARTMLDRGLIADKTAAKVIFENIKTELIGSIDALSDTLSAPFSKQLKDRVTHLHEKIGYPDWVLNQTQVNLYYNTMGFSLDPAQYLQNVMHMAKFRKTALLMSYEETLTGGEGWDTYMGDTTASYYLHGNDIHIPLYYLFAPVYSHDMPDSFNYGGMGAWVGYYMVYALEDDWRTYTDDKGNILPTNATEADKEAYKLAKGCNDYIANVTYLPPGEPEPIPLSVGWNSGVEYQHNDIIATRASYKAFKRNMRGSQSAPGLPDSSDRVFYLAVGQFYCSAKYDHHSYYHKLLNAIAASSAEFTKAFGCQATDLLYNSGETTCYL